MSDDGRRITRRCALDDGTEAILEVEKENQNPNKQHPKSTGLTSKRLKDEDIEILILEVEKRIPLWNFAIPIEERSREKIAMLWEEVSAAMQGKLSAANAKKKFKALRDVYRRVIQTEHHPSGSARSVQEKKWKFYGQMEFLRGTSLIRPTSCNVGMSTIASFSRSRMH